MLYRLGQRRAVIYEWQRRSRAKRKRLRFEKPLRARERTFVRELVALSLLARPRSRAEYVRCAVVAVGRAYRTRAFTAVGKVSGAATKIARRNIGLPRIQQAIADAFEDAGVGLEACAATIRGVMEHGDPETRLRAVELVLKATTGFATQKSTNLNITAKSDTFFDPEAFAKTGPPKVETHGS